MYKSNENQFSFQFIFVMLIYLIIVILAVMIVSLGKNIYSNINEDRNNNYNQRVSLSFISNKIKQSDKKGSLAIKKLHGADAVVINEVYDKESYQTWIYFYQGAIYEMFTDEGSVFELSEGMRIVEIDFFEIEKIKDNLYKFTAGGKKGSEELYLSLYAN